MKKFYLKNGKEVQIGDTIMKVIKPNSSTCKGIIVETTVVTEHSLPELIKKGIITPSLGSNLELGSDLDIDNKTLHYYIEKLAKRLNWKVEKMYNYLGTIASIYPAAPFSMILKEIAIELDNKYRDHISNSPEIYVISMFDGRITKANKAHIKSYKNFAAFRSIEDAKIACSIVKPLLKDLFGNGKQEDYRCNSCNY